MLFLCSEQKRKKTDTEYSLFNVRGWVTPLKNWTVKVYIFREGHKFLRNLHLTVMPEPGGPGGPLPPPPQYLADQLTLFEPRRADYPHLVLLWAPQKFFHLPASL